MNLELLNEALSCLENVTPLKTDCGEYCNHACCIDNGEAGSCVWLINGEDDRKMTWAKTLDTTMPLSGQSVRALYCESFCDRRYRPFMCRIFPLTPYYSRKREKWSVRMDRRAAAICPLYNWGKKGLSAEFVQAAEQAVNMLAADDEYRKLLETLESEEAAYRIEL